MHFWFCEGPEAFGVQFASTGKVPALAKKHSPSKQVCVTLGITLEGEIEKGVQTEICNPLILLVRPAGFEPTTPWFVARYSIHLSYGRL